MAGWEIVHNMMHSGISKQANAVKEPEEGGHEKEYVIIIGSKATEISRDRSQRVMFVEPERT